MNVKGINNKIFVNLVKKPNFQAKDLLSEVPNKKVSKGLTYLDIIAFRQYVNSKQFNMDLPKEETKNVFRKRGKNFISASVDYLMQKLGIPLQLKPVTYVNNNMSAPMSYMPQFNQLNIKERDIKKVPKLNIFVALRHELRHMEQNLEVMRCEKFGLKIIKDDAKKLAVFDKLERYISLCDGHVSAQKIQEKVEYFNEFIKLHPKDQDYKYHLEDLKKIRRIATKSMGKIDDKSEKGMKIIERYKSKGNGCSFSENLIRYHFSDTESEAYLTQKVATHNMQQNKGCLFKKLKQNNKYFIDLISDASADKKQKITKQIKEEIVNNPDTEISFLNSKID